MAKTKRTQNRVYVPEEVGYLYSRLTAEGSRHNVVDPVEVPFFKYKDVFLMAAALGYQLQQRKPLPKGDKKREIRLDTFNSKDIYILKAIALAEENDIKILLDGRKILSIAEEYAYVGIKKLESSLLNTGGQPLWNLLSLIRSEQLI